jgi:hypothetical protein
MTNLDQKLFDQVFDFATADPYCFFYVNLMVPRRIKAYKNFAEEILF